MKIQDFLTLSSRALTTKTSRTLLTILGMGVGVGAVLFLVSLGFGLRNVMVEEITTDKSFVVLDVTARDSEFLKLSQKDVEKIKVLEGVRELSPVMKFSSKATFDKLTTQVNVLSTKTLFFGLSGMDVEISEGRIFTEDETDKIVITESLAALFEKTGVSNVGKNVRIKFLVPNEKYDENNRDFVEEKMKQVEIDLEVVGILAGYSEDIILAHHSRFDEYSNEYSLIKVETDNSNVLKEVRQKILDMGLSVASISDTVEQANKIFQVVTTILAVFGIIALVVSAIGMFNTMTITLLERTNEIGVMKSIGASNTDIAKLFVVEAAIMGFLGSIAGVLMGLVGSKLVNILFNIFAIKMGGEAVDIFHTPTNFIVFVIIFGSVIGFLTGIFPARRAGKLDPLDALRYK